MTLNWKIFKILFALLFIVVLSGLSEALHSYGDNRAISVDLCLGEGRVRNYVTSILAKLKLCNRAQAAAFAVKHRLDELPKHSVDKLEASIE